MLSKAASSIIFWVLGMTRPGIEPLSPGPLVNTLLIRPMSYQNNAKLWTHPSISPEVCKRWYPFLVVLYFFLSDSKWKKFWLFLRIRYSHISWRTKKIDDKIQILVESMNKHLSTQLVRICSLRRAQVSVGVRKRKRK